MSNEAAMKIILLSYLSQLGERILKKKINTAKL